MDFGGGVTRGAAGWKKTYGIQAQLRAEQFDKVVQFTVSSECRMAALIRHFGDVDDASTRCGICDICDPAGAELRQFRRASSAERAMVQRIIEELRPIDYRATGTLQRSLDVASRAEFDGLLDAMTRLGLIEIEEAEFEKEGEVIRFRKVRLTDAGLAVRPMTPLALLISDGIVESLNGSGLSANQRAVKTAKNKSAGKATSKAAEPAELSTAAEALAAKLRKWRADEAKRLQVPVFIVMHDRTLNALAAARPRNPRELLEIDGIGPTKVERFGRQLLELCAES